MFKIGIPSANRPQAIQLLLEALDKQLTNTPFQVIVANGTQHEFKEINADYERICGQYSNIRLISDPGGPANGRKLIAEQCADEDIVILLDDDTFPCNPRTIQQHVDFFKANSYQLVSGIWNCQKNPSRPYGSILHYSNGFITRQDLRTNGIKKIHIPLATFCGKGSTIKRLRSDSAIPFYGDMLDIGLSILFNGVTCAYNSDIVYDHLQINNSIPFTNYRQLNSWQYISNKWNTSFFIDNKLYGPETEGLNLKRSEVEDLRIKGQTLSNSRNIRVFLVELNPYHYETLPVFAKMLEEMRVELQVVYLRNQIGIKQSISSAAESATCVELESKDEILKYLARNFRSDDTLILNSAGRVCAGGNSSLFDYTLSCVKEISHILNIPRHRFISLHHGTCTRQERSQHSHLAICLQPQMALIHNMTYLPLVQESTYKEMGNQEVNSSGHPIKRLLIAGQLEMKRRDYGTILEWFAEYYENFSDSSLRVLVLGGFAPKDRKYFTSLFESIQQSTSSRFFELPDPESESKGKVPVEIFEQKVMTSHFLLYAIHPTRRNHFAYSYSKGTGSYSLGLTNALVPVTDTMISSAYRISDISIRYSSKVEFLSCLKKIELYDFIQLEEHRRLVANKSTILYREGYQALKRLILDGTD